MGDGTQVNTFEELVCSSSLAGEFEQYSLRLSTIIIFFSLTAFLGNSLIFVALHKVSSLHPPSKLLYRCLATSDLLVGLVSQPLTATLWLSVVFEEWRLCRFAWVAASISGYGLSLMSLLTMAAMSVDRLLALFLGLRYKQIVTLKRTYIIVATLCIVTFVATLCNVLDSRIAPWFGRIVISCCLLISIASYAKIFCALRRHHAQIQNHVQQQPSQPNALNMARYRKAVYSALWVQLMLLACYVPVILVGIVMAHIKGNSSHLVVALGIASTLVYFNSTLNPFLYCWKISEIILSITTFLGNSLILVALHKESSLHPPSKLLCHCLATTDLLVGIFSQPITATYFMSLANENWSLCRYASDATFTTSYTFCGVSLLTMTAISVDRLLALLLGLRYRQTVTLERIYIMVAAFWVLSSLTGLCCILNYRIALWLGRISISLFLLISITSYTKIFRTLSHHQAEVQHHVQQQLSQPNALNMVKYRKAVYSALWVQFALVV
ncbi:unnamed protein product [Pocillopora meandrina]|uniref:G-protein coupled receptors family 1 profile domain-containing protein n=1 Tax=Pocillopora meandrina TaxID=46732 RepID=A0AAU9Y2J2_9CNID|nr:unnamed protein product [Pocillopora meandrina]